MTITAKKSSTNITKKKWTMKKIIISKKGRIMKVKKSRMTIVK